MSRTRPSGRKSSETVLVIEDDRALREGLALNLKLRGYAVRTAADGEEGLRMAFDVRPDLILLDIMLPHCSGLEIIEELRARGEEVPVLVLSARGATSNKVEGLNLGADDYLAKPFDLSELLARVEAMLRRRRVEGNALPDLVFGPVRVNQSARTVRVGDRNVSLSAKEFDLLCLLGASPGQVFTRETILERVWGWGYEGTARTVDNHVANLRRKLKTQRQHIQTVRQIGYKLVTA